MYLSYGHGQTAVTATTTPQEYVIPDGGYGYNCSFKNTGDETLLVNAALSAVDFVAATAVPIEAGDTFSFSSDVDTVQNRKITKISFAALSGTTTFNVAFS